MNTSLNAQPTNPKLSPWVRVFFSIAATIVLGGSGLYFIPDVIAPRWLWPLTPFNANFLGALYFSELIILSLLIFYNRWAPARVAFPISYIFTGAVTIISFFYLDHFNFQRWSSYFWFVIYIGSTLAALLAHRAYYRLPVYDPVVIPQGLRTYMLGQGSVQALYGLALLVIPGIAGGFWPWPIDEFHGRVYSAIFLGAAAGTFVAARSAAALELRFLGVVQIALGFLTIAGLFIVDLSQHRVNWLAPGTWIWLAGFCTLFVAGLILLRMSFVLGPIRAASSTPRVSRVN